MKKLTLALAVSGALGVSATAHALVESEFGSGVLVPHVLYDGSTNTAVGLTSCAPGRVYWTFFDRDSKHIIDGDFRMTQNDFTAFLWTSAIGTAFDQAGSSSQNFNGEDPRLKGELGYLVFILDTGGISGALDISDVPCLAGNAFQLFPDRDDVAYLPAPPLSWAMGDFGDPNAGVFVPNLTDMRGDSVRSLEAGARADFLGDVMYLRYRVDGDLGGADSAIVIWSAQDVRGSYTVNIYDLEQNRASTNLNLNYKELNVLDVEQDVIRPVGFNQGFIYWDLTDVGVNNDGSSCPGSYDAGDPGCADGVTSFTIIFSEAFQATQTVINPVFLRDNNDLGIDVRLRLDHRDQLHAIDPNL